jgi:hypothetical protein
MGFFKELFMDLVGRYLQAVQFWLPKKQREDIIAELSEDLHSQIEEREGKLGHKLNDDEISGLLKRSGSPLVVASRYLPQRYLIGPTLYPVYIWVMAVVMLGCTVPRFAVWLGFVILDPAHRGALHMENLLTTIVAFAVVVTLSFAIIERTPAKDNILDCWNPRKLPSVRQPNRVPRATSLFEIAVTLVWMLWLINVLPRGRVIEIAALRITLNYGWYVLLASSLLMGFFHLAVSTMNLVYTHWTSESATMRLGADALGGAIFCWFLKAQIFTGFSSPQVSAAKGVEMVNALNWWMGKCLPWAVLVVVAVVASDVYRLVRLQRSRAAASSLGVLAGT